ncbi:MAG: response regulator, partial [Butyricimonas virosa]|uniref:response regulator n=1 Tax=Butyricimonas virosa TaxID=544645 RepID=UPI002A91F0A6
MERKIKLLYAEDQLEMRELYTRILSGKGFDVHAVEDGREAGDWDPKERGDSVWLDMDMPTIDGA